MNVPAPAGDPGGWADQLARIVTALGFTTLVVVTPGEDPIGEIRRLGAEVAPRLREMVG